jgi:hypothetical protein
MVLWCDGDGGDAQNRCDGDVHRDVRRDVRVVPLYYKKNKINL